MSHLMSFTCSEHRHSRRLFNFRVERMDGCWGLGRLDCSDDGRFILEHDSRESPH
jgi:hypothetical protein